MGFRRYTTALATFAALCFLPAFAAAQNATFSGRVTSAAGQPLGGASVGINELGVGGVADAEGRYNFTVDVSGRTGRSVALVARYIGYKPKRMNITLTATRSEQNFTLDRDVLNLEEVIVTGTSEATSQKKATFAVGVVDNSQLKEVPSSSPLSALQGKIPGLSVVTTSGQPGSASSIRLRAATSLTGRQDPLIIIDGTISRLSLADINSEDIERVEVIKGAAASSLYGSDAANGVVQIFTKRGASLAEGQTSFTARTEYGQNSLPKVIEGNMSHNYRVMCGATACTGQQAGTNAVTGFDVSSGGRTSDGDLIADNRYPVYYDQLRKVFRSAEFMTNYVSVGQRRGNTNFNGSFQNTKDAGVLRLKDGFSRQNFRLNVDQALTDNIDLGMGAFYGRSTSDQGEDNGIFFGLRFLEPNINLEEIATCTTCPYAGQYNPVIRQPPLSTNVVNPLYVLSQRDVSNERDRFNGTFRASYRPLEWLTGEASVGYDEANQNYRFLTPLNFTSSGGIAGPGFLRHRSDADRNYNTNLSLTANRSFWDEKVRNTTKAAFLYEAQTNSFVRVDANGLTIGQVPEFGATKQSPSTPVIPDSRTETIRAKNYFLISTFDIKDRYILDGLVRQDQSSLFGANERTAIYHRLSAAWRVTEDFSMRGIDEFKLRASLGTAGLRPPFTAQYEVYSISGGLPKPLTLGNENLKPAYSRETEYGFNMNFLTNYSLEYSFSQKKTTDQIMRVPLSAAAGGYQTQWQNAGTLEGNTHEMALGAVLLSQKDYFWRVNVTGDQTRQKITDLKVGSFLIGPFDGSNNAQMFRIAKGQPFGVIYGDRFIKTAEQLAATIASGALTGTTADYVKNSEGFYVRTAQHQTINEVPLKSFVCTSAVASPCTARTSVVQIGDVNPNFTAGFNTTAQWKGVGLNGTVSWISGGDIYNYTRQWPFNELRDAVIDQSGKPDPGVCPALAVDPNCPYKTGRKPTTYYSTFYNNFNPNDFFVEKGSYVRLRELALNYNLPAAWAARIPAANFRTARIGIVGRNLWTSTEYSGYDPDVTAPTNGNPFAYRVDYFTYPAYRTFTAMLELGF